MEKRPKNIVLMGGGTGSFAVLLGLRDSGHRISAIVTMSDSGGSSGLLRDELGVLPPGDVRQCLVALSRARKPLRELFTHRFSKGSLKGHSVGNLFLAGLEDMTGSFDKAVKTAAQVLQIRGYVIPVTLKKVQLCMRLGNGKLFAGEVAITSSRDLKRYGIQTFYLKPRASANPEAISAIKDADIFIMAPGNLYSSLIPNLLVRRIPQAIEKSKAKKIYIANLMTKRGQTDGFGVDDFVNELERWAGMSLFTTIIYNTQAYPKSLLVKYKKEGSPVLFARKKSKKTMREYIGASLLSDRLATPQKGDLLAHQRSLIRHDPKKLAALLEKIIARS